MTLLTEKQRRFIELDKHKADVKAFFEDYAAAINAVVEESGLGSYFQDDEGTVYKTIEPSGTFVSFQKFGIDRTRRNGERAGTLSMAAAEAAGFELPKTEIAPKTPASEVAV